MTHADESVLVERARTDPAAFGTLYDRYMERIYSYAARQTGDVAAAQDITAATFEKALRHIRRFQWRNIGFAPWLYRIASNESLTFIEQQKKRQTVSFDHEPSGMAERLKADKDFDANKLEWKLQMAIQQLPEKQKLVFSLRYYDEMPYEDMSRILETSEGALKASYHHAVRKIEEYILNH